MDLFEAFFRTATEFSPWPYQRRLAMEPELPSVLHVPTGAGKTAAVLLSWLWRRRNHPDPAVRAATPRRLVYTLPMRVLVTQTLHHAQRYVTALGLAEDQTERPVRVALLMGGSVDREWWLYPEDDMILVGTSDMLLSRALNRAYGESRFHWSIDFGLLNNDALWVFDEVQLMSEGLATSRQLDGLREKLGSWKGAPSLWMSATYHPRWMETVDALPITPEGVWRLTDEDLAQAPDLAKRMNAPKHLHRLEIGLPEQESKVGGYLQAFARTVTERHRSGTLTLVVVNTVDRAQRLYRFLLDAYRTDESTGEEQASQVPEVLLLHSQFRPGERDALNQKLLGDGGPLPAAGRVIVATQVVEAGVDVSARTLITELAPWPSLVQRFGRVNRYGENPEADVLWAAVHPKVSPPYSVEDLEEAARLLGDAEGKDVSPASIQRIPYGGLRSYRYVLRRKDLVDLFDTTPDLSGNDVDVSRFIRSDADLDAQVFWRTWPGEDSGTPPPGDWLPAQRAELCPVPVYGKTRGLREFVRRTREKARAWRWDHIDGRWVAVTQIDSIRPGQILLLPAKAGGYDARFGWTAEPGDGPVEPVDGVSAVDGRPSQREVESTAGDPFSTLRPWITLREHTDHVVEEVEQILRNLEANWLPAAVAKALRTAARYHDWGKAHPKFQHRFLKLLPPDERDQRAQELWAKAPRSQLHPLIRHEVASALAMMAADGEGGWEADLAAFLVMSHHGKVRVGLRSLPGASVERQDQRLLLGIADGDRIPEDGRGVDLGGGVEVPPITLDLSFLELGAQDARPSWLARVLELRDRPDLGPFRLAYLEALLRAGDVRASMKEVAANART